MVFHSSLFFCFLLIFDCKKKKKYKNIKKNSCWRFEYFRDVVVAYTYDGVYAIDNLQGLLIF